MKLNKKNKFLIFGVLAMIFASYKIALEKTLLAKKEYNQQMQKQSAMSNLPQQLSLLSQKERNLDQQLLEFNLENTSMQSNLFKFLNLQAVKEQVAIIDFKLPHIRKTENEEILTHIFILQGGYTAILKTLHALESKSGFGSISHVGFEKKRDYRSKRTYLQAEVFLEQSSSRN
ncbi:hypothetical protein [Flagellimonas meridianipacifica]|uniref:Uncharacterized protein n=1 Tax=Flagellimonas meridianipacifica TaxID=1080225 RepID=A0A2T0MI11_9FLAO|nr:hypothetical protein [Allomuricauda pacifica]PRX57209.1 hypothetical protein CLV81_1212 [Allomuricauda pacifica]